MKTSVSVIVTQPLAWKGQSYAVGQSIQLTPLDAVVLAKKHQVTLTRRKAVPLPEPPAPPPIIEESPTPKRGRYKRRDLQAEDTAVMTVETPTEASSVRWDAPSVAQPVTIPTDES